MEQQPAGGRTALATGVSLPWSATGPLVVDEDTGRLVLWECPERVAADLVAFLDDLGR